MSKEKASAGKMLENHSQHSPACNDGGNEIERVMESTYFAKNIYTVAGTTR
jgi:hypothetical protein